MTTKYSYASSVKSNVSDELINTYLIRPLAGIVVRVLFSTPITPNQVTLFSTLVGIAAAGFYFTGGATHAIVAGLLITLKDILDSADGQLARAKQQFSRAGRFLDSIGDLVVNVLVFAAIAYALSRPDSSLVAILLGILGFLGSTLRVSYHVFYHTSFLHQQELYQTNRITEEIQREDLHSDALTLRLQRIFLFFYGWQDRLMMRIDAWCRSGIDQPPETPRTWYADKTGLRLSGLMGLGTELFLLMLFSVANKLEAYLIFNVLVLNGLWAGAVVYRRWILRRRITR
ncbi:MAG: CDP-alcohol phosphatidyltransferase family protein [Ignavibacteriae bacterium]|nr:CDP-alcohol phosphatidyltransferase family protein [Ignavibacteriota bacterium]